MKRLIIAALAFILAIGTMPVSPAVASAEAQAQTVPFDPGFED